MTRPEPRSDLGRGCAECEDLGFWWITNSGYRAYPYRTWDMDYIYDGMLTDDATGESNVYAGSQRCPPTQSTSSPHKQSKPTPSSGRSLLATLGLLPKIHRRL